MIMEMKDVVCKLKTAESVNEVAAGVSEKDDLSIPPSPLPLPPPLLMNESILNHLEVLHAETCCLYVLVICVTFYLNFSFISHLSYFTRSFILYTCV